MTHIVYTTLKATRQATEGRGQKTRTNEGAHRKKEKKNGNTHIHKLLASCFFLLFFFAFLALHFSFFLHPLVVQFLLQGEGPPLHLRSLVEEANFCSSFLWAEPNHLELGIGAQLTIIYNIYGLHFPLLAYRHRWMGKSYTWPPSGAAHSIPSI